MNKVFYCYSPTLKCELLKIGEKYIAKTINQSSKRICWLFLYTDNLIKYLNQRTKVNKKINPYIKNPNLK